MQMSMASTLGLFASPPVAARRQPSCRPVSHAFGLPKHVAMLPFTQQKRSRHHIRFSRAVCTAQQAEVGKTISRTEIPAFIPRQDMADQLIRWAHIDLQNDGASNFGLPMRVEGILRDGGLWGFSICILRDGNTLTKLSVTFDEEVTSKHEWVGRGADGFPILEGNVQDIMGKHLVIRKVDDNPVDEQLRAVIRDVCSGLVAAINKYYAFGSCFSDDAT